MLLQLSFVASAIALVSLLSATETAASVVHYPPSSTNINNFTFALNGSGAPGIFTSSTTPNKAYGEYNWCNMPHVRTQEYKTPSRDFNLEYVEVIQRHHKRTPYASNTFFKEDVSWSCVGQGPLNGLKSASGPGADVTDIQASRLGKPQPILSTPGPRKLGQVSCQFPQITEEGLEDSITHGKDLRAVYASRLGLSSRLDASTSKFRVTNNQITSQVASGLVKGLFPGSSGIEVLIEAPSFDSLEPTLSCNTANQLKTAITTGSQTWNDHLTAAADLYAKLDGISGTASMDSAGWHSSFDHYYDNMSAKQCHGKTLPCDLNSTSSCVTQDIFRDAPESAQYSALRYGAWVLELQGHLQDKISGQSKMKYFHNIAHDGSVAPLLGFLQISNMVWPGMGSEIAFELYSKSGSPHPKRDSSQSRPTSGAKSFFLRVLWGGQPMETSTPLGTLDMIPIADFFSYVESMTGSGSDLYAACNQ
ncbi:hypothetical protein DXG01_003015 [Tephrocybe rancida]|nr:hypothetical protein DXG01_003015 [Tephrocybe rancida]